MFTTIAATAIGLLLLLTILAGLAAYFIYWSLIQRAVPDLEGEFVFPGLEESVTVLRDKHGVPHIQAQNRADLFRAQGYVHAQDRLWQMEQNRRTARGTLAELFGLAALETDRYSRIIGFRRAAQVELAGLGGESRQLLEWYCQGVNAYRAARPGRLAAEFNLLRVQPAPWTPEDVLAVTKLMAWSMSVNWESELVRLQLAAQMAPHLAADLEPDYPQENPVILEAVGSQEALRLLSTAGLLLQQYEQIQPWIGPRGGGLGSNGWVVAPQRSQTGRALLCNDPHLPLRMPGIWYENHLTCPDLHVSGAIFPGTPGVLIGHNEHLAWGVTNAFVDTQDLYLERPHPEQPDHFAFGEEWEAAQVVEEVIQVRRRAVPHVERVVITRHGPLINGLVTGMAEAKESAPLALRWTGHAPGQSLKATLGIMEAATVQEFDAALADWAAPVQNFICADDQGAIHTVMAGHVPIRANGLGLLPAPGWTGDQEWTGVIPHPEMPRITDPESGLIVTANNKMVGDDYPYWLGIEFMPGWRAARIEELLQTKNTHTVRDMERIQLDSHSKLAEALTPWLASLFSDNSWEKAAINFLRSWSHTMESTSEAALIYHFALLHLLDLTFGDKLGAARDGFGGNAMSPIFMINGFRHRATSRLLELLKDNPESRWYTEAASGRLRSRDELVQEAFSRAIGDIRRRLGDSTRRWAWGRLHQIRYIHPMGSVRILRGLLNRGPFPVAGDGATPNVSDYSAHLPPGLVQITASYRQICEVGRWDQMQSITTSGQSGHPLSRLYDDQMAMWREGVYRTMAWSAEAVDNAAEYRMTLLPHGKAPG